MKAGGLTNIVCDAKQIRLAYEDSSEGYLNSPYVIGFNADGSRTLAEWPIKRLKAPPDRVVDVSTLSFYPKKDLEDGEARKQILHQQPVYEFLPIEDGYFPFDGPMPMSTSQLINHRPMMLSRLEGFAGFGDRQSQVWLDEVKRTGKPYYPLKEVTWYIGEKKRTIPIAKRHLLKSRKKTCG
ncbi:MAG: hypothetical protein KDA52_03795 [Planctomycetaceae bacterium]|nr:hypothetical protein [Planctomycetaceae bacterium]